MKLAKLQLENFRHLGTSQHPFTLDFSDALGRVRDFTLLVGPNTSGKTTILDAVAAALGPSVWMPTLRPDFKLSPRTVVRRGALHAKVTCWLRFSPEEITATREIFRLADVSEKASTVPDVKLTWTYPDSRRPSATNAIWSNPAITARNVTQIRNPYVRGLHWDASETPSPYGLTEYEPEAGWTLLQGRFAVAQLLATGRADWSWFHRVGGVFTFDQERSGLGKSISRQIWNIIHGTTEAAREKEELRTADPRTILIEMALQSLVPSVAGNGKLPDEGGKRGHATLPK